MKGDGHFIGNIEFMNHVQKGQQKTQGLFGKKA